MKLEPKQMEDYFPNQPYSIQITIANKIHQALQSSKTRLIILQSPTGTGKTNSILCPILYWISHNQVNLNKKEAIETVKTPIWLKKVSQQKGQRIVREKLKQIEEMKGIQQINRLVKFKKQDLAKSDKKSSFQTSQNEEEYELDSDHQNISDHNGKKHLKYQQKMIERQFKVEEENVLPKLIFVSRTHSQLSQVIDSIKTILKSKQSLRFLEVASKQHLCINKQVNHNKNSINQRCQMLMDNDKCSFFHQMAIKDFFNKNLEETLELGENHKLCPYYSSRNILQFADVLCLPYASILNQDIRSRLGINLNNSIVVFDEGHNLLDFQKQLHSPDVQIDELSIFCQQIDEYLKKYHQKLKIKNSNLLIHLFQILRGLIKASKELYQQRNKDGKEDKSYMRLNYIEFLLRINVKQIKIQKIKKYFQLNNMDKKLAYFNSESKVSIKSDKSKMSNISVSIINKILSFLLQLANFNEYNQHLLLKWENKKLLLKILCYQSFELQKILQKCRMMIIAGGTMQPLNEILNATQKWKDRTQLIKCDHIIKQQQCKIYMIKRYSSKQILFNYSSLSQKQALESYRNVCTELMKKVLLRTEKGGGIVLFIQNYQLLTFFQNIYKNESYFKSMIFDSKQKAENEVGDIFSKYKRLIQTDKENHHILVSVMGGKLSEGINFSDRLARSIIVFGLPYSNMYAAQILETMSYIDSKNNPNFTGKIYYQNLCIKTLNQTIGRGIRHIKDYADIYLVDSRFQSIRNKLSGWMQSRIVIINDMLQF